MPQVQVQVQVNEVKHLGPLPRQFAENEMVCLRVQ
jgi:hypothetical protein